MARGTRPSAVMLAGALATAALFTADESAGSRVAPYTSVWEFPPAGALAPRNARVAFLLRIPPVHGEDSSLRRYESASLLCVSAGAQQTQTAHVPVKRRRSDGHRSVLLELLPEQPLPASSSCAVISAAPGNEMLSWFRVSDAMDSSPPATPQIRGGRHVLMPNVPSDFETSGHGIIELSAPRDDSSDATGLLYAVWVGKEGAPIDYNATPATWLLPSKAADGRSTVAFSGDHEDGYAGNFPVPNMGTRIRVGLRVVDLTGKRSVTSEAWIKGVPTSWQRRQLTLGPSPIPAIPDNGLIVPCVPIELPREAPTKTRNIVALVLLSLLATALALAALRRRTRSARKAG
jgi:hypothetical protein